MPGYDPDFLDVRLPLPGFSPALADRVLRRRELRDQVFATYGSITIAMHGTFGTALFAAQNIDRTRPAVDAESASWWADSRIGRDNQLDPGYFTSNPWDQGRIARLATFPSAGILDDGSPASDVTYVLANGCLQHRHFDQRHWRALETWAGPPGRCAAERTSVVTGPIYGGHPRSIHPDRQRPALIPAAFFKIVAWTDRSGALGARAFIMAQDADAMNGGGATDTSARRNARPFQDFQCYQVSIREIEERTGLVFDASLAAANPLRFEGGATDDTLGICTLPERIEVDRQEDMISEGQRREIVADDETDVFIAAAIAGNDAASGWVSIINLTNDDIRLDDWSLRDGAVRRRLAGHLAPGEAVRIQPLFPIRLNEVGGTVALYDADGARIDRVRYAARNPANGENRTIFPLMEATGRA